MNLKSNRMCNAIVSVIIPVYNSEKYLAKCILSVINQSFKEFEVILINDGSTDKSGVICEEYAKKDSRVKVFHKENNGVSTARNLGLKHAVGEWICFIDSDDWISSDYLVDFNIENNTNVDIIIQGYKRNVDGIEIDGSGYNQKEFTCIADFFLYSEKHSLLNSPCFKLFRKDLLVANQIFFDPRFSLGEDHIFTLSYFKRIESFSVSEERGYFYRKVTESSSLSTKVIDLRAFKEYIIHTDQLRSEIMSSMKGDESYINEMYEETNKWIVFAIHSLLDSRRVINEEDRELLFIDFVSLLKPKIGLPTYSIKGTVYNIIILRILKTNLIKTRSKIEVIRRLNKILRKA